jgi:hypothetical protein
MCSRRVPQPQHIVPRLKPAIFVLRDVCLREHERFCFRILLLNIPTRSWQQLRTVKEMTYSKFAEAARIHGLILDRAHEARTAMLLAKDLRRPPSDVRFLFALGAESGATDQM